MNVSNESLDLLVMLLERSDYRNDFSNQTLGDTDAKIRKSNNIINLTAQKGVKQ
jgi:hypothetical protein